MGYRNKIALLDVKRFEQIKDKTYKQLADEYGESYGKNDYHVGCYELAEEIYEIGKYWEHDFLKPFKRNIFVRPSTNKHFNDDCEFYIIGKEGLKAIIDSYHKKIADYYKKILNPDEKDVRYNWHKTPEQHIHDMLKEWQDNDSNITPYNLREDSDEIVSSWNFEYQIFELVRLYKTIDYENNLVCLTGW